MWFLLYSTLLPFAMDLPEIDCLALNLYHESRNQSFQGQLGVAFVTINRAQNSRYPNSICGVVYQSKQFSWTHDGKSDTPYEYDSYTYLRKLATILYYGDFKDITHGATHYHADYVAPYWAKKLKRTSQIDKHIFYR